MSERVLVAYFSATGTTRRAAEAAATALGADLHEIVPEVPYTSADLDWHDGSSRSSVEMGDDACRPPLAGAAPDLSPYDLVLVGFPVWWGVEPRAVDTFLDDVDLAGRRAVAFATSGGSGVSGADRRLRELYPAASWGRGALVTATSAADWARSVAR